MLITFRLSALGYGGTERVFLSIADFISKEYNHSFEFVIDKINEHETEKIAKDKGYNVIGLNSSRTWRTINPFRKYIKTNKPDIIISAYTETNSAALISNLLTNFSVPIIVTEHASLNEHWANRSRLKKILLEIMVRYIYKLSDQILCVSSGMIEQISTRINHKNIDYIHNPVRFSLRTHSKESARALLNIPLDVKVLIAIGRISKQKNYFMLLNAINKINLTNFHLYIIGGVYEASEKEKLTEFITKNNLGNNVKFIDFTHDIHAFYEAADILVLSSAWEGFGNVIVEALSFGLPVVSTRCNYGPAEILANGKFGVLVDVDDHVAMGKAIQDVLQQESFTPAHQIARAQDFSERNIGEAYQRLINKIIDLKK